MKKCCLCLCASVLFVVLIKCLFVTWVFNYSDQLDDEELEAEFNRLLQENPEEWSGATVGGLMSVSETEVEKRNVLNEIRDYFRRKASESVKYYLYDDHSNTSIFTEILPEDSNSIRALSLKNGTKLKVLLHGFTKRFNSTFPREMKNAFLENTEHSVLIVDWSKMAGARHISLPTPFRKVAEFLLYTKIVDKNIPKVGRYVGKFLAGLRQDNVISAMDSVHLIGHSLGAHVSGQIGLTVQSELNGERIGRITGLDPAGPFFQDKALEHRLDKSDAAFVDIIHTSHLVSDRRPAGHVDFYPNSDSNIQPGCTETNKTSIYAALHQVKTLIGYCDHHRAIDYYTKSITDKYLYGCKFAQEENRKGPYRKCSEDCDASVVFGEYVSEKTRGEYCLKLEVA